MAHIHVEICCASLGDCKTAYQSGADAIELVSAGLLGGLTPSEGLLYQVKSQVPLPVNAMVRPRGAGFCYTDEDFQVMCEDARRFSKMGADGIVFGFLLPDGNLDYEHCARFLECTGDCETVFHRAIDVTPEPVRTAERLVSLGVTRILTSGGAQDALAGADVVRELERQFGDKIQVMAGGGIRASNVLEIVEKTKVSRVHLGGTSLVSDPSTCCNPSLNFGASMPEEMDLYPAVDGKIVERTVSVLREAAEG